MKISIIIICIIFLIFGIENNNLSVSKNNLKEIEESYEACRRLKEKAPLLNLKCEHILDNFKANVENDKKHEINNNHIKTIFINKSHIRKVNKNEEKKLRNLIQNLSKGKKLRKD